MALASVIADLQDKWLAISGIKAAPDFPNEIEMAYPFVVTYERSGEMQLRSGGWATPFPLVYSELHVSNTLLSSAIQTAMGYRNSFLQKIRTDPTLSDTCQTVTRVTWTFGNLTWAGIGNIGYRFEIAIKEDDLTA